MHLNNDVYWKASHNYCLIIHKEIYLAREHSAITAAERTAAVAFAAVESTAAVAAIAASVAATVVADLWPVQL